MINCQINDDQKEALIPLGRRIDEMRSRLGLPKRPPEAEVNQMHRLRKPKCAALRPKT